MPPSVLTIKSVMSVPPMANTYCKASNNKLTPAIGRTFFQNGHIGFNMLKYRPNGMKIRTFIIISGRLVLVAAPEKGIKFNALKCGKVSKENCILNKIIQTKAAKYTANNTKVSFVGSFLAFSIATSIAKGMYRNNRKLNPSDNFPFYGVQQEEASPVPLHCVSFPKK